MGQPVPEFGCRYEIDRWYEFQRELLELIMYTEAIDNGIDFKDVQYRACDAFLTMQRAAAYRELKLPEPEYEPFDVIVDNVDRYIESLENNPVVIVSETPALFQEIVAQLRRERGE